MESRFLVLVVQYLVGSLKIPLNGSNNLIFLDQVKRHCGLDGRTSKALQKVLADLETGFPALKLLLVRNRMTLYNYSVRSDPKRSVTAKTCFVTLFV